MCNEMKVKDMPGAFVSPSCCAFSRSSDVFRNKTYFKLKTVQRFIPWSEIHIQRGVYVEAKGKNGLM